MDEQTTDFSATNRGGASEVATEIASPRVADTVGMDVDRLNDAKDPRTIAEMKAADSNFTEGRITKVTPYKAGDGFAIDWIEDGHEGTWGCGITDDRNPNKIEPEVGDRIRIYGSFGSKFYGIDLNGVEVFWETEFERAAERVNWLANYDREKRERFAAQKSKLDEQFENLSPKMKARIQRFRDGDPFFRVDSEGYEAFACAEADKIAAHLKPRVDAGEDAEAVIKEFHKAPYDETAHVVSDQHSGNTFGGACNLALAILTDGKA